MRTPYAPARKGTHGAYTPRSTRYPAGTIRQHRNAAGMSFTASRGGGPLDDETRTLAVFGTLDPLRRGLGSYLTRLPCPCCGSRSSGRLALSDAGRLHLRTLRRRRAARLNCEA